MEIFDWVTDPTAWAALFTLTALEIVLGVDNIIFISILVGRLPEAQRARARQLGLGLAMFTRIALLLSLGWLMSLTQPIFSYGGATASGRDLILFSGGLFLLWKSVSEMHNVLEGPGSAGTAANGARISFAAVLVQIALIDIVFSLDSVITAVGMANDLAVMVIAIVLSVGVMMVAARPLGDFVERHPTVKMLALAFLVLIGVVLIAESFNQHIPKGYIYFAMAFAVVIEFLNLRARRRPRA